MNSRSVFSVSLWLILATIGRAQQPPAFYDRGAAPPKAAGFVPKATRRSSVSTLTTATKSCRTITYEGVAEKQPIPVFNGVASAGWVAGISVLAYGLPLGNPSGGHAQFDNQPSGVTAAVFLNGSNNDITFATPISAFQYYYATGYPTQLTAYDSNGNILAQHPVPPNWSGNANGYDVWTQIPLVEVTGNKISKINILSAGPALNNFLGIDDLTICTDVVIDSVEMTQAIQQIQTLSDLQTSLSSGNEAPVPIIAGKPGAMRVYMKPVTEVSAVKVRLTIPGVIDQSQIALLIPGCDTIQQRMQGIFCPSTDFYFTPPAGRWDATLNVTAVLTGDSIEQELLSFKSRETQPLRMLGLSVCDSLAPSGLPRCGFATSLLGNTFLLEKIAPTNTVSLLLTANIVRRNAANYCGDVDHCSSANGNAWFHAALQDASRLYTVADSQNDVLLNRRTVYFGMVRPDAPGPAGVGKLPGHAALAVESIKRFASNTEANFETIAHETGHTLGLKHTFTNFPPATVSPPGCYGFANDASTDWPWKNGAFTPDGNNRIQSLAGLEVPFDISARQALNPDVTYEIMSYCLPRWISPLRTKTVIKTLNGGVVNSPLAPTPLTTLSTQPFWIVTGTIPVSGPPVFGPLFQSTLTGDTSGGAGAYSLEVQTGAGAALFTQQFNPETGVTDIRDGGTDFQSEPDFAQLVPVTAGAARIALKDPNGVVLGSIALGGAAPTVTITSPTASFSGTVPISWTISDPDSSSFTSRIYYSPDNGVTWSEIGELPDSGNFLSVDFSLLPGTNGNGLIRVLVSDGVNTGAATSPHFSIAKKTPSLVKILAPTPNFSQPAHDRLFLEGAAYDVDDGVLSGSSLAWSSDLQGALGTGSRLFALLQPGVHKITLTATDSDNNSIGATTTVTIGDAPPVVDVTFKTLSSPPTSSSTCVQAVVNASPGVNGAPLAAMQYSIDGGASYSNIGLDQLPYTYVIPGTGFIDLVVSAVDTAHQVDSQSASYFNSFACAALAIPNVVGMTQAGATSSLSGAAMVVGKIITAASTNVPAGTVIGQNPPAGTNVPPGASDAVDLTISSGSQVPVPNVVGQAQAAATTAITAAGLVVGTVTTSASGTVAPGSVIGETPAAGTSATAGSAVNLVVSSGVTLAVSNPPSLPAGTTGAIYASTTLAATGGSGFYSWAASGLPNGLNLDSNSGVLSGIPASTSAGSYNVQVTVTDSALATATRGYGLTIAKSCDITHDGSTTLADVQLAVNEALGVLPAIDDLNQDGAVTVVDVQIVINAALNLGCTAH